MDNRSLGNLLRRFVGKNIKKWDLILPQIEFVYNRSPIHTTKHTPFKMVYEQNLLSPLDLVPYKASTEHSIDVEDHIKEIRKLYEQVKWKIEK